MKIAMTGGAGFIGTQLAHSLKEQGHDIVILDTQLSKAYPDDSIKIDICNADALKNTLKGVDAIYHLAAEHHDNVHPVSRYYDVNVDGGKNLIQAAEAHGINTIIFTSTVAVYGLNAGDPAAGSRESDNPSPFNDYGKSKYESEKLFEGWAAGDKNRSLVMVRLVATFGPGNRGNIYTLINQIHSGKFIMVGSGQNKKSVAYVGNVAKFLSHCLSLGQGTHLYNYADKPDLSMKDMVNSIRTSMNKNGTGIQIPFIVGLLGGIAFDILAKILGRTFPISTIRVRKFCANTIVNADHVKDTGFEAPFTLEEGLKEMIKHDFES